MAQGFDEHAYIDVFHGRRLLSGREMPPLFLSPVSAVTADMLRKQTMALYDTL
ncbi:MAG: hypothetical protein HIU92_17655 [Proteobacteria bacterium]|nr:hypothetical protein [Pseudomonadota bacterium]